MASVTDSHAKGEMTSGDDGCAYINAETKSGTFAPMLDNGFHEASASSSPPQEILGYHAENESL